MYQREYSCFKTVKMFDSSVIILPIKTVLAYFLRWINLMNSNRSEVYMRECD